MPDPGHAVARGIIGACGRLTADGVAVWVVAASISIEIHALKLDITHRPAR